MELTPFNDLMKKMPAKVRESAEARYQELRQEVLLKELRQSLEVSQAQLARKTGFKTPNISRLERQHDMQITTLRKIITALGGKLEIIARFGDAAVRIVMPK